VFFWEFPWRPKYKSWHFGTQCRFHRPGQSGFLNAQEDGTDIEFRNVGFYTSDAGEIPKRTQTTFWTRRKSKNYHLSPLFSYRLTSNLAVLKFSWFNKQWAVWHCAIQIKSATLTASNSSQHIHLQYGKTVLCFALKSKRYHIHVYRIFTIKNCKQRNFPLVYNGKKSNCQLMLIITLQIIVIFNIK
jgi:hypothetical protein